MKKTMMVLAALVSLAFAGVASAALPADATTALTGIQTDGLAMISAVWPVVAAIVGGFALIKLFKRGVAKI